MATTRLTDVEHAQKVVDALEAAIKVIDSQNGVGLANEFGLRPEVQSTRVITVSRIAVLRKQYGLAEPEAAPAA